MSQHTAEILTQLKGQASFILPRVRSLLRSPEGRIIGSSDTFPPASQVEPIWRTRLKISTAQGTRIEGLASLVEKLRDVPGEHPIRQVSVVGAKEAATLFFDAKTKHFLGAALVEMSAHTRAYFRSELISNATGKYQRAKKPAGAMIHQVVKAKKVTA